MEFQNLVDVLSAFGWQGLLAAALILIAVYVAKRVGLVATPNQARIANVVMAAVIYGMTNPQSEGALLAVLSALLASLAHKGLELIPALKPVIGVSPKSVK
jgi:hypothetical protein